jgi:hypothetical protein
MKPHLKQRKPVYGVGINDFETSTRIDGKPMPEYNAWKDMLKRCYDLKFQASNPTYIGCSVSNEWHSFTVFYNWLHANSYKAGLQLDKDIIVPGNKIYSPETCCLVPPSINSLLLNNMAARGNHPQGVCWHKPNKKFMADLRVNGRKKHLGCFTSVIDAERAYLTAKAAYIRSQALSFNLPVKVINALFRTAADMEQKAFVLEEAA